MESTIQDKWLLVMEQMKIYLKSGHRKGQALFNAIYDIDLDFANTIRASEIDCFYIDENVDQVIFKFFHRD